MPTDQLRTDLAAAIRAACKGQKHPAAVAESWHAADRLRPFVEAHAAEVAARELDAIAAQLAWRQKWRTVRLIRRRVAALKDPKTP